MHARRAARPLPFVGVAIALVACLSFPARPLLAQDTPAASPTPLLLISIDGFRWDYLDRHPAPNLRRIATEGFEAKSLVPAFPSKTFPNHDTIVTGLYPEHHGIVDNTMIDPVLGRFSLSNRAAVADGRWWGGEPIWVTAQRQGLRSATFFWPGSEAEIGGMRPTYWMEYDTRVKGEDRVQRVLDWLDLPPAERPSLITLYWSDVDSAAHEYGPDSPENVAAIARVDAWMGLLLAGVEQRGLLDRINMIVVSDHGMASTPAAQNLYLEDYIDLEGIDIAGGTPMLLLWPPADRADSVRKTLGKAHPALTVWRRERTPKRWHFRDSDRIAPLLVAAAEGWNLRPRRDKPREGQTEPPAPPLGMHGFDPRLPSMHGFLIGRGPQLASRTKVGSVDNVHLYELMCRLLEIEPAANDGRLKPVAGLLAPTIMDRVSAAAATNSTR